MNIQLGLGLIGIGRPWGHITGSVPPEAEALALLDYAVQLGVRYFDTAPSYGVSEERLGKFLHGLRPDERNALTIATKFGEHWEAAANAPFVDHSYDALRRSLDRSLERLGRIEVLQLHKTTPAVLVSIGLVKAWDYAEALGIVRRGPSVSDQESALAALAEERFRVIQLPYSRPHPQFAPIIEGAVARGVFVAVNRPFAMGSMLYDPGMNSKSEAFRFVIGRGFEGVVLTGTRSPQHLRENWVAFHDALSESGNSLSGT